MTSSSSSDTDLQAPGASEPFAWSFMPALMFAMFAISSGYGFLLPILPVSMQQIMPGGDPLVISRHTGILAGLYPIALFFFAPLWGRLADRSGRKWIIVTGLLGLALSLALFAIANTIFLLYLLRFLNGVFAAAVTPTVFSIIGQASPTKEKRAFRFALMNIAAAVGFLAGPSMAGITKLFMGSELSFPGGMAMPSPYLAAAFLSFSAAIAAGVLLRKGTAHALQGPVPRLSRESEAAMPKLLSVSFVTAFAIGSFEVGLSLRATTLADFDPSAIGLMFAECSLVMLAVQTLVFSSIIRLEATRKLIQPSLLLLAAGLAVLPYATSTLPMAAAVGLIAASAGIVSPLATYWISLGAADRQGAELGSQTAAASLGQAAGSMAAGLLFGFSALKGFVFPFGAIVVIAGIFMSRGLSGLLYGIWVASADRLTAGDATPTRERRAK
jgi:MFS family permease